MVILVEQVLKWIEMICMEYRLQLQVKWQELINSNEREVIKNLE